MKKLSDHELDELHTLLAALSFGQKYCDSLDTNDTLFNRVAKDLQMDMRTTGNQTVHSLDAGTVSSLGRSPGSVAMPKDAAALPATRSPSSWLELGLSPLRLINPDSKKR